MSETLRLLQWNTWFKEKARNVLAVLQEQQPDIACLQEVTQNYEGNDFLDIPQYLATNLGYEHHYAVAQYWPGQQGNQHQGNLILSRYPLRNQREIYVQDQKHDHFDDYSSEGRVLVMAEVVVGGAEPLTVATTHLSYTHRFVETPAKLQEEEKMLEALAEFQERLVVAGDFNVDENSELVAALEQRLQLVNIGPGYDHKTWTTKPFEYQGFAETKLRWRLDHVFASADIQVVSSRVVETPYSDHLPVVVEVVV